MGSLRLFVVLSVLTLGVLYTQAAPPRTLKGDTNVNPLDTNTTRDQHDVTTDERFYRVYENGTIEFKTALSNGHVQYQRISNRVVDGRTIQVYEGYVSQRFADGRYGTSYYVADENGYRRTRVEVDTVPPVLPRSGPYAPELSRSEATTEHSTFRRSHGIIRSKTNSIADDTVEGSRKKDQSKGLSIAEENLAKLEAIQKSRSPTREEKHLKLSPVLPTSWEHSNASSDRSTEKPLLPVTEESATKSSEDIGTSSALPTSWENSSASSEDEKSTEIPILPVTEESATKSTEDIGSSPVLPTSWEHSNASSEDEKSTEIPLLPVTEESATKSTQDIGTSTALPTSWENSSASSEDEKSTEIPPLPVTEKSATKSTEDIGTSTALPTSWENSSASSEYEKSTEIPSLLVTEESATKSSEDVRRSPVLPTSWENSIAPSEDEKSTEIPTLPVTEESATKSSEYITTPPTLPITDENSSASSTDAGGITTVLPTWASIEQIILRSVENSPSSSTPATEKNSNTSGEDYTTESPTSTDSSQKYFENSHALSSTEDSTANGNSTDLPASQFPAVEDEDRKVTEEITTNSVSSTESSLLFSTERSLSSSSEYKTLETSTKATAESETSTELPSTNDGKDLEAITELTRTESDLSAADSEEGKATSKPSALFSKSEENTTKGVLEKDIEASTELPVLSTTERVLTHSTEENVTQNESSTELPALSSFENKPFETSTELPALGNFEGREQKSSKDEHAQSEKVTELPNLDVTQTAEHASTEVPVLASTELPVLGSFEEPEQKSSKDEHSQSETSTGLPNLDVTQTAEHDSTEGPALPAIDKNQIKDSSANATISSLSAKNETKNDDHSLDVENNGSSDDKLTTSSYLDGKSESTTENSAFVTTEKDSVTKSTEENTTQFAENEDILNVVETTASVFSD